jgi:predicted O-linked N-acetylglucosamine transferase (SPINDLY family)
MGLGYPSSTWGSQIDYVISGGKVEPKKNPESNYSERLVLLPHYGVMNRAIAPPPPPAQHDREELIITCPWSSDRFNYPWLFLLTKIVKELSQPVKFRFLIDTQTEEIPLGKNYYLPLIQAIEEVLGSDTTEIIPHQQDETFFSLLAAGDLTLDSYPFSNPQTMVTALSFGQPIAVLHGKKWHNRLLAQLLSELGLGELVSSKPSSYIATVKKLLTQPAYRHQIRDRLATADLQQTIFNQKDVKHFVSAINYLIANHQALSQQKSRKPITIK